MIELTARFMRPFLFLSPVRRVRRNHGLEHATIHVLSARIKNMSVAGRAVLDGFFLYGNFDTQEVLDAAQEAIDRMRRGEHNLAVHPNCGTGLVTAGFLTSIATMMGMAGVKRNPVDQLSRIPTMILFSIVALIVAQPTSFALQQYFTTLGDPGNLEIVNITRQQMRLPFAHNPIVVHKVWTKLG
jgi:hypothetical protein